MKRAAKLALQLLASGALMWLLLSRVGIDQVADRLALHDAGAAGVVLALIAAQYALGVFRWRLICSALGVPAPAPRVALAWIGMGAGLSQILPSSIGGDAYRILALGRHAGIGAATRTVVAERVIGLLTLSAMALVLSLAAFARVESSVAFSAFAILSLAVLGGGAIAGVIARLLVRWTASRLIRMVADDIAVLYSKATLLPAFGASVGIHALSIGTIVMLATAMALDEVLWWQSALVMPGTLLVSSIPVSLGGWGIRESSMVLGLAAFGVSEAAALALSIGYGIAMAAAGALGLVLWVACGQRRS